MQMQAYQQRILLPAEGKWLYQETTRVISDKVYLGIQADEAQWVEITEEEKKNLESLWEETDHN